jgi:hypothetical protein
VCVVKNRSCWGPLEVGEGSLVGASGAYERKVLGMGVSPMGARLSISAGPPGGDLSTEDFVVRVLCEGNLEVGPLAGDP